jgi:hypothetical protein
MKKTIFFLFILIVFNACSSQKKKNTSAFLKGFHTQYNTLFNGEEALKTELEDRKKSYKDNFYTNYIPLLKYEKTPVKTNNVGFLKGNELGVPGGGKNAFERRDELGGSGSRSQMQKSGNKGGNIGGNNVGGGETANTTTSSLDISEIKAQKAIRKYSVIKGGEEKNKRIFDAYILLTKYYLYQNNPLQALETVNDIYSNFKKSKKIPL